MEVLVAMDLACHVQSLHIDQESFLVFKYLKARVCMRNGIVLGGQVPPNIGTIGNQPWPWRPR